MMKIWISDDDARLDASILNEKEEEHKPDIVYCIRCVDFHSILEQSLLSFLAVDFMGPTVLWKASKVL